MKKNKISPKLKVIITLVLLLVMSLSLYSHAAENFDADILKSNIKDITLPKDLRADTVTVTFDSLGKFDAPEQQTIPRGGTATEPSPPEIVGHDFKHWFLKSANEPWDFKTPIHEDITLRPDFSTWTINIAVIAFRPATGDNLEGAEILFQLKRDFMDIFVESIVTPKTGIINYSIQYGEELTMTETVVPTDFIYGGPGPYICKINDKNELVWKNLGDATASREVNEERKFIFHHYKEWPMNVDKVSEEDKENTLEGAELEIISPANYTMFKETSGTVDFDKVTLLLETFPFTLRENIAPLGYMKNGDV